MKRQWIVYVVTLSSLAGMVGNSRAQSLLPIAPYRYFRVDIPNQDNVLGVTAFSAINGKGEVVGYCSDNNCRGFLLGGRLRLHEMACPGDIVAQPMAINAQGDIAGICHTSPSGFFLGTNADKFNPRVLKVPHALLTEPSGLNGLRQVVGDYRSPDGVFHGFIWRAGAGFVTVDFPGPDILTTAVTSINDAGVLVGFYHIGPADTANPNGRRHGFIRDAGGHFTTLELDGAEWIMPQTIANTGAMVGLYLVEGAQEVRSFLRTAEGDYFDLAVPFAGAVLTRVTGINPDGLIVGFYLELVNAAENQYAFHGFVGTPLPADMAAAAIASSAGASDARRGLTLADLTPAEKALILGGLLLP